MDECYIKQLSLICPYLLYDGCKKKNLSDKDLLNIFFLQKLCQATEKATKSEDDVVYSNITTETFADEKLYENLQRCRNPEIYPGKIINDDKLRRCSDLWVL